jgi:hypothetical protein
MGARSGAVNQVMICTGTSEEDGVINVRGSYAAPPGAGWGWRTRIGLSLDAKLYLTMFNVTPDGKDVLAVEGVYVRADSAPLAEPSPPTTRA